MASRVVWLVTVMGLRPTASFLNVGHTRGALRPRARQSPAAPVMATAGSDIERLEAAVSEFTAVDISELSPADAATARALVQQLSSHLRSNGDGSPPVRPPIGSTGTLYDAAFLSAVRHLCPQAPDTGTELMAPLLYSLVRSTRPSSVVELGCGYTTLFLAQALRDAARDAEEESVRSANWPEEQRWLLWGSAKSDRLIQEWAQRGAYWGRGELWERAKEPYAPTLQCVDSFGSEDWQAGDYEQTARQLGLDGVTSMQSADWLSWEASLPPDFTIDFLWWDGFVPEMFDRMWRRVSPNGGLCVLHSTLGNHRNWAFVQDLKLKQATQEFRDFELLSLLEPHKWAQNSCTVLRKTSAYEPGEVLVRPHA